MAGQNSGITLQLCQPLQGGHHLPHTAAGKVRASTGVRKQGVAADEHILTQQANAALGMAGGAQHLHLQAAHSNGVPFAIVGDLPAQGQEQSCFGTSLRKTVLMAEIHTDIRPDLTQAIHTAGVVVMAVGQQDAHRLTARLTNGCGHSFCAAAGIYHGADLLCLVTDQIAVGAQGCNLHHFDFHGNLSFRYS